MKNRIGLCLAIKGTNYGMLLQAFATQYFLDSLGCKTEIIDYNSGHNKGVRISFGAVRVAANLIFNKVKTKYRETFTQEDDLHRFNKISRKNVACEFRKKYLHDIISVTGISNLQRRSEQYDAVLVGSDQIWPPGIAFSNFYTLRFAANGVRRISYATSLGVSEYPEFCKKSAKDYWEKIDFLSVREEQGKKIIKSICNAKVEVVVDPTYLLTQKEWETIIPNKPLIEGKYILYYFLGENETIKRKARCIAESKKLKTVCILSDECNANDCQYFDEVITGAPVEDFVNLIRNAEYILTDSFHGVAMSIIHHKQFFVFYRKLKAVSERFQRNSRIDNIVEKWDIEDRLIRNPQVFDQNIKDIDYENVDRIIERERKKSVEFLYKALDV